MLKAGILVDKRQANKTSLWVVSVHQLLVLLLTIKQTVILNDHTFVLILLIFLINTYCFMYIKY